jgi:RimJ/RimL family protein N-acetyltransferase
LKKKWPSGNDRPDGAIVADSARLLLRELNGGDAAFILELLNEPSFLKYIGDKGARTLDDARRYIADGPRASYAHNGFGLYLVQIRDTGERIGICGLVKREALYDVDIGFAFLPAYWSKGYAVEASHAVMHLARTRFQIPRVVAITSLDNQGSMRLLRKIGLTFARTLELPGHAEPVNLFVPAEEDAAGGASAH